MEQNASSDNRHRPFTVYSGKDYANGEAWRRSFTQGLDIDGSESFYTGPRHAVGREKEAGE